jgi:nitrous oxidase accessory protein NosD
MEHNMRKLTILYVIFIMFFSPIVIADSFNKTNQIQFSNILFVGGSGPGNYTTIQSAIDNASDGDTIFVYELSSPYFENLVINTSIYLIGEDKNTTVIDGEGKSESIMEIVTDNISIKNFNIQNSRSINGVYAGINIRGNINNIVIDENIIQKNFWGIFAHFNNRGISIINNLICFNDNGIVSGGINSKIINNQIIDNEWGIDLLSFGDTIVGNTISGSVRGINFDTGGGFFCDIRLNNIINNEIGVQIYTVSSNVFKENNFIGNNVSATFDTDIPFFINRWARNYWDDIGNKKIYIIHGIWTFYFFNPFYGREIKWYNFDIHPAKEPYDI